MAIIELNLEKPALVEEYRRPDRSGTGARSGDGSASSGGRAGALVAVLAAVVGVALLAWRRRRRGSGEDGEQKYEHGPEPEIGGDEGGGAGRKLAGALGVAVALVGVAAVVRGRRR